MYIKNESVCFIFFVNVLRFSVFAHQRNMKHTKMSFCPRANYEKRQQVLFCPWINNEKDRSFVSLSPETNILPKSSIPHASQTKTK